MTKRELAEKYVALHKEFDRKHNLKASSNAWFYDVAYLTIEFTKQELQFKVENIKSKLGY